jgi:thiosulfate dehydrogenase
MKTKHSRSLRRLAAPVTAVALVAAATATSAREPFTPAELKMMNDKLTASVQRGYDLWYGARADMSNNGLACANCHPDAAATNPQTFPKYMPMFNKVVPYREMVNWCIANPQGGKALDVSSEDLVALEAYSFYLHNGVKIETGLQTRQTAGPTPTNARGFAGKATGIGFDK